MSTSSNNASNKKMMLVAVAVSAVLFMALAVSLVPRFVTAESQPANKMAVAGSALTAQSTSLGTNDNSGWVTIMAGTIKTSNPTDLVISHSQECSIMTNVKLSSSGSTSEHATASQKVRILIDGQPVPVFSGDNGEVVFCERAFKIETNVLKQIQQLCDAVNAIDGVTTCEESYFNAYLSTKDAHSFNWIALNVGSGVHTIEVQSELSSETSSNGEATVAVGKRTLVVEPTHLAVNAEI